MRKNKIDLITGSRRQPLILVLYLAISVFGGLSYFVITFPYCSQNYIKPTLMLGVIGIVLMVWLNYSPSLWIKGLIYLNLMILMTLFAARSYLYMFSKSGWFWVLLISASVIFSYMIPIFSQSITKFLRDELTSPKTPIGKRLYALALFFGPIIGVIGSIVGINLNRNNNLSALTTILGTLFWAIAIFLPFATRYPVTPFEKE